MYIGIVFIV